jgi:transcriptional regulator with XRE-family HTH domain
MDIASRIKSVREAENLNIRIFASKLRTSAPTISRLENGQRTPDVDLILRIVDVFKCDLSWLMTGVSIDGVTAPMTACRLPVFRELPTDLLSPPLEVIEDWIKLPGIPSSSAAIYCQDDSAAPLVKRGDLIIFVPGECAVGDLAIVIDQWGEPRVRRVKSDNVFFAENPEYRDQDVLQKFKLVGKVIKIVRDLT